MPGDQWGAEGPWGPLGQGQWVFSLHHLHLLALALGGLWQRISISQVVQVTEEAPSTKII